MHLAETEYMCLREICERNNTFIYRKFIVFNVRNQFEVVNYDSCVSNFSNQPNQTNEQQNERRIDQTQ